MIANATKIASSEGRIKTLFAKRPGAGNLLIALLVISLGLIWAGGGSEKASQISPLLLPTGTDRSLASGLKGVRQSMLLLTGPVYFLAQTPYALASSVSDITSDRQSLLQQRDQLNAQLLGMKEELLRLRFLQAEITRLRQLLGSSSIARSGDDCRDHRRATRSSAQP